MKGKIKLLIKKTFLYRGLRKLKYMYRGGVETYQQKAKRLSKLYPSEILWGQDGNDAILELLVSNNPVFISRFGSVELSVIYSHFQNKKCTIDQKNTLENNAGFFPVDDENIKRFSELYFDASKKIDALGVWFNDGEAVMVKEFLPSALLVELGVLNSFLYKNPYTQFLKNKKVLVIHPFEDSIKMQLKKRELLFKNKDVLPEFELQIIRAPQTIAGNHGKYKSWFEAFEETCEKIKNTDFDIALVGCGAYGLPIGAYVKSLGKSAIHIGGALQLLFGIKGRRWIEDYGYDKTVFNENWIFPLDIDRPNNLVNVEGGCYW